MSLRSFILKSSALLVFLFIVTFLPPVADAQVAITFQGHVKYSTGEPVAGATVTMTVRFNGSTISSETTATDAGGNYVFQSSRSQPPCNPNEWLFQAFIAEIVDDEALPLSNTTSSSGCVGPGTVTLGDLVIVRPRAITLGGVVRDQFGTPVQGLTITMTRTKYDFEPDVVTTAITTTDGNGHYQFNTYSRCSVVEDFRASIGSYTFQGGTSTSGCVLNSNDSLDFTIDLGTLENAGRGPCNRSVGRPVNIANGNVYLQQTDYQLPGVGESIIVARSYNSVSQVAGLFGRSWSSIYDEKVTNASGILQLTMADGRVVSSITPDFFGQIVQNGDMTYTVTFKSGNVHRFNTLGKLISLTDRNGNQTTLSYDVNGKLASIADPFGRVLTVATNANGHVLSLSDSMEIIASYAYGGSQELLSVRYGDNSGYQFAYVPVPTGLALSSVTDVLGNVIERHDYDTQGRAITSEAHAGVERYTLNYVSPTETDVTDALGRTTKFFYHNVKGTKAVTQVEGVCGCGGSQVQTWTYDSQLNVTSHANAMGQVATYTYDASGNQISATGVLGTSSFTYNQLGQVLTATDAMNGVTTNNYDAAGNLLSVTDALNNTTTFTYDARGQLLTMTNALGKVTTLGYDPSGNISQVTDAVGNVTRFAHNTRGRLTNVADPLNNATAYAYDAADRVNRITRTDGTFVAYTYDLAGRRTKFTDALNNSTMFAYDGAYRLTGITDAALKSVSYTYDLMSNVIGATDQLSRTTNVEYDEFNRPVKTIYPPAVTGAARLQETVEYDAAGNVTKRTDTAGRATTFTYDNANRLVTITDPLLQVTSYEYNARSNLTAVVDALGQRYTFDYDALGRVTSTTRAGLLMTFAYDAVGNRTLRTDYNNMPTTYTYDALNRRTGIDYPDSSSVRYAYDKLSRLTSATNVNGTVTFVYDNLGRINSTTDVWGQTLNYTYDGNDRRTKISIGATTNASYLYDAVNRVTRITDSSGKATTFTYDAAGQLLSRALPNSVVTSYTYDGLSRVTQIKDAKNKSVIANNQYSYNSANQIVQNIDQSGTHVYGYDALDQLTSASYPGTGDESYAYDAVGNRTSSHRSAGYTYQPFNRLTNTSTASYLYDNNGNLTTKTDGAGTTQFVWDFENRLTQVVTPSSGTVSYNYDALGRRIQSAPSNGPSTNFTYDGQDIVQDRTSTNVVTEYTHGPGFDNKLRQKTGKTLFYFAQDRLGSTTALTDSKGALVERQTYDVYGNSSGSTRTRYGFTGRERESLTGLIYYRARFYDPQLGRFISEDPIGLAGGSNQFAYVRNNPQNKIDPSGLYEIDVHYYLTYYLAVKTGCFSDDEAREIANGNQETDEKDEYSPGAHKVYQNATYHGLHSGSHEPFLNDLWTRANAGQGSLEWLGRYLHYSQDTFSHADFADSNWGHSPVSIKNGNRPGTHAADKTDNDVAKAQQMVAATWNALRRFASEKCNCNPSWTPEMWDPINRFLQAPTGPGWVQALATLDPSDPLYPYYTWGYLENRRRLLGMPLR